MSPASWPLPVRLGGAVSSGLLLLLAFPPFDVGWVALGALVPLLLALRGASGRAGALVGFVFGATFVGVLIYWISYFGWLAWGVLTGSQALLLALFGWLGAWASRTGPGRVGGVPLLYAGVEMLRTRWPLGGFAWGGVGYSQDDGEPLLALARVGGVFLVSLAVVAVNALLAQLLAPGRAWRRALAVLGAGGLVAAPLALPLGLAGASAGELDVALVQGNVPRGAFTGTPAQRRGRTGPEDVTIIRNHVRLSEPLAAAPPDLVIWPENAVDRDPLADRDIGLLVEGAVRTVGAPFLVGAILDVPGKGFRNTNLLYDPDGRVRATYDKIHLVPFGEYVPWPWLRRYVGALEQIPEDGIPGEGPVVFDVGGAKVGAVICFESTYPDLVRSFVREGAQIIVVSTNNASFRRSPASRQHLQMSRLRAVEEGRVVVHAAISGISAVVDPGGRLLERTDLFRPGLVRRTVPLTSGGTPYSRFGEAIEMGIGGGAAIAAVAGLAATLGRRRDRRYREAEDELWGGEEPGEPPA